MSENPVTFEENLNGELMLLATVLVSGVLVVGGIIVDDSTSSSPFPFSFPFLFPSSDWPLWFSAKWE